MKTNRFLAIAAALLLALPALADTERSLTIAVKEQRPLPVPADLERIAVADPEIADVIVIAGNRNQPGSILLTGKQPGTTVVTAWSRNRVETVWQVNVQSQLQGQLPDSGADLRISNGNALLRGESASTIAHARTAAVAAASVSGDKILDASTVKTGGMVQIDVKIVEFNKAVLKEAGFDFLFNQARGTFTLGLANNLSASLPNATPASSAFNLLMGLQRGSFSVDTSLKLIEKNGLARVLAQPSLTALSGQTASFLAGGELPIPQSGGLGTVTVQYKPFGIGLTVTPTVLAANRIALKVAPEASDVDYENVVRSDTITIPAISTRRAETTLELGDGESFIIGGLVSRTTRSNVSKLPVLGDLPIIGTFFRSMRYSQDEKELVIVVTPHLVKPLAKGVQVPLAGEDREKIDTPVNAWGAYLMGVAAHPDELPGFSK